MVEAIIVVLRQLQRVCLFHGFEGVLKMRSDTAKLILQIWLRNLLLKDTRKLMILSNKLIHSVILR